MTGNTVKVGIALQQEDWAWAGVYFTCVSLFALGTVFALFMIQKLGSLRSQAVGSTWSGVVVVRVVGSRQ